MSKGYVFMHCKVCDREMSEKEITWNEELNDWEICSTCLEIALDTAFSNGIDEEDQSFVVFDDSILYGDSDDMLSSSWEKYSD